MPNLEKGDTMQSLLRKWAIHCVDHQPPSISMQGEFMLCAVCALSYAKQAAILVVGAGNEN